MVDVAGGFAGAAASAVQAETGDVQWPCTGQPILHTLELNSYSMHAGGHGTLPIDWDVFLRFLKMHLRQQ